VAAGAGGAGVSAGTVPGRVAGAPLAHAARIDAAALDITTTPAAKKLI
jgi:hypothetical protein